MASHRITLKSKIVRKQRQKVCHDIQLKIRQLSNTEHRSESNKINALEILQTPLKLRELDPNDE